MNMPGFTAEATLYNSATSYRSSCVIHTEIGLNVTPQLAGNWPYVWCNLQCLRRFRDNPDRLYECLHDCDSLF